MNLVVEGLVLIVKLLCSFVEAIICWVVPTRYKSVKDEVCLITGAGSGLGRLMALEFAKRGAVVVLWDINEKGSEETAELIRKNGGTAIVQKCDVTNKEEVYKMAQSAQMAAGNITILVNNAGILYGKPLLDMTDREIERTMQVNSLAHFWTVRAFLPSMLENNHGHIVTIASVMGFLPIAGMTSYVTSKHAATGFNNSLQMDLRKMKKDGIKTTLACPYHTRTGFMKGSSLRFPSIVPSLEPEECVKTIMHAVLTDRRMVSMPRSMYLFHNLTTWLPNKAQMLVHDFIETSEVMTKFIPNREYQKEARNNS